MNEEKHDEVTGLIDEIKQNTLKNRDETIKIFQEYSDKNIVLFLIEIMKKYSQSYDEEGHPIYLTGQYMVILDSIQTILTERKAIKRVRTWTLENFLNDIPFFSEVIEEDEK